MKIVAFPRTEQGSGASRRLRAAGLTPGIVYGGTSAPLNIKLDHNALYHALRREAFHSSILDMEIDGKAEKVLLRDFQMHAYKQLVMHVDFQRVDPNQKIHMKVPLHFKNEEASPAVKTGGGIIHHAITELDISCLPADLPEFIEVDMSAFATGQTLHLGDLKLPAGVTATESDTSKTIANATAPTVSADDEEEAAAPAAEAASGEQSSEEK